MKRESTHSSLRPGWIICCVLTTLLTGCAESPAKLIAREGLDKSVTTGTIYRHVVLSRAGLEKTPTLHVYIGGDGTPWVDGRVASTDPTPKNPLTLNLMLLDSTNAVFVGRPCYHGLSADPGCNTSIWTSARYSEEVGNSIAAVINRLVSAGDYEKVVVIGYSGGGALARLIAPGISKLAGLLTVAGNLDIDAWTDLHSYRPLSNSLNPANQPALAASVLHVQAIGQNDNVVPPSVTGSFKNKGGNAEIWVYESFDHVCCWTDHWPTILRRFELSLSEVREFDR